MRQLILVPSDGATRKCLRALVLPFLLIVCVGQALATDPTIGFNFTATVAGIRDTSGVLPAPVVVGRTITGVLWAPTPIGRPGGTPAVLESGVSDGGGIWLQLGTGSIASRAQGATGRLQLIGGTPAQGATRSTLVFRSFANQEFGGLVIEEISMQVEFDESTEQQGDSVSTRIEGLAARGFTSTYGLEIRGYRLVAGAESQRFAVRCRIDGLEVRK